MWFSIDYGFNNKLIALQWKDLHLQLQTEIWFSKVSSKIVTLEHDEIPAERKLSLLLNSLNNLLLIKAVNKTLPTSNKDILSCISSIFDPLGILASATYEPRLIIQELWKHRRNKWKATLHELPTIEIPRWYSFKFPGESALELHVFADASSCAYGAVPNLRFKSSSEFKCSFMIDKSRNTQIKENSLSITKLELQVAFTVSKIKDNGGTQRKSYQWIPLARLENCIELFAQRLFKFWSIRYSLCQWNS